MPASTPPGSPPDRSSSDPDHGPQREPPPQKRRGGGLGSALFAYGVGALFAVVLVLLIRVIREEPQPLSEPPAPRPRAPERIAQPALERDVVLPPEVAARARREARQRSAPPPSSSPAPAGKASARGGTPAAPPAWSGGVVPDFGELTWPAGTEIVTSEFGPRVDPVGGERRYVHRGLDVRCGCGTPVLAALSGRVARAGHSEVSGNVVRLEHAGNRMTRYAHLARLEVKEGDRVVAGQRIGLSGATGRVTGPHLHFEIWEAGKPLDPRELRYFFYPAGTFTRLPVSARECGTAGSPRSAARRSPALPSPSYAEGEDFGID